jgi:hypothetical protein
MLEAMFSGRHDARLRIGDADDDDDGGDNGGGAGGGGGGRVFIDRNGALFEARGERG